MKRKIICIFMVSLFLLTMLGSISIVGKTIGEENTISNSSDDLYFDGGGPRVSEKFFRSLIIQGKIWGSGEAGNIELTIDWGDGTTTETDNHNQRPGSLEFVYGHDYSEFKKYTIKCTATEKDDINAIATEYVTVNCASMAKPSICPAFQSLLLRFPAMNRLLTLLNPAFL